MFRTTGRYVLPTMIAMVVPLLLVGASGPAAAHAHVTVGDYALTIGWRAEPPTVGLLNGLDLGVQHTPPNGTAEWVLTAEADLSATLSFGSSTVAKAIAPQEGRPGWYTFDVIPTRAGTYSVRLTGSLNGTAVDVSVDLDPVGPASDLQFPTPDPTPSELQQAATTATLVGGLGAVLGLVGLGVGAVAWRRGRTPP